MSVSRDSNPTKERTPRILKRQGNYLPNNDQSLSGQLDSVFGSTGQSVHALDWNLGLPHWNIPGRFLGLVTVLVGMSHYVRFDWLAIGLCVHASWRSESPTGPRKSSLLGLFSVRLVSGKEEKRKRTAHSLIVSCIIHPVRCRNSSISLIFSSLPSSSLPLLSFCIIPFNSHTSLSLALLLGIVL